jgi:hypothetical protein
MKSTLSTKIAAAAAATGMAVAALLGVAGPAQAADTTTTFSISTGSLGITVPSSASLGSVASGALTVSGQLGSVSVADTRGALVNAWTATVSSTAFVTGTSTANETVAKTNIVYSSGAATSTSGLGTFVPGTATMTAAGTGAAWTGAAGNATAAWNPTLALTLLPSQVAGTYTGTVTHSIA